MSKLIKFRVWDKAPNLMMGGQCELMQFTGKEDINGKEIYEADILGDTEGYLLGVVAWDKKQHKYVIKLKEQEVDLEEFESSETEVLGNIYESPGLLSEEEC